jgi:hypothetical protein
MINFLLLVSRQGKTRLSKWYEHYTTKEKARAIRELTNLVLARAPKMCNFIEWRDKKVSSFQGTAYTRRKMNRGHDNRIARQTLFSRKSLTRECTRFGESLHF